MKKILVLSMVAVIGSIASANTVYYSGALAAGDTTFVNPGGATGTHYYDVLQFTVSLSGAYTFELASPNTALPSSNALDTYLRIYATTFNPLAPGAGIASNDDFTGTLTVLPGTSGYPVTSAATGFTGAQPSSRLLNVNLTAGTNYFLINTSFRQIGYVGTGSNGLSVGNYYGGVTGQGTINIVPEPATMAALGLGAVALLRRRRK